MIFKNVKKELSERFAELTKDKSYLFRVELDKDELWNLYLDSYPEGTNEIFRERREHDCSCCRNFIKNIGNVVVINDDYTISTIWGYGSKDDTFSIVAKALDEFVLKHTISGIYLSPTNKVGTDYNFEDTQKWEHFFLELDNRFVNKSNKTLGDIYGNFNDIKNVFNRSLNEFSIEGTETILELINQGSLYRGEEWKSILKDFLKLQKEYSKIEEKLQDNFAWHHSTKTGAILGKIRNHSIGTLLIDVSKDVDLDIAVKKYESIVAPTNYKRPKAIFTKKMLEQAQKTVMDLGYMDSLGRRFAMLEDITINNVLYADKNVKLNNSFDIFEEMKDEISVNPRKFNKCEEISIDNFINNVLPDAKGLEVLFENNKTKNLVSLIAPENKESKTMFKWNNNFGWSYNGNIADSNIKENVSKAGGKVDGALRFSIQWNDGIAYNESDYDAHCVTPSGNRISFENKKENCSGGNLDVDIITPKSDVPAVENITFPQKERMTSGKYLFSVHGYTLRNGNEGFSAEIEFDGQIFNFVYNKPLKHNEFINVAEVSFNQQTGVFSIRELIPSTTSSKKIWNISTQQFIPVSIVMYSPNYWDEQKGIGNKHYMFMLKGCSNPDNPNGFYNEFLKSELSEHKRVFEALGSKMKVEDCDSQLSGLGFSSTQRNEIVVKVKGNTERILKIKI